MLKCSRMLIAILSPALFALAQTAQTTQPAPVPSWQRNGGTIPPGSLPPAFAGSLKQMGNRLTSAAQSATSITGMLTDSSGTRAVQVTVQAPGYLLFLDGNNARTISYNGVAWQVKNSAGSQNDQRVEESLLAHSPDSVLLQLANGSTVRWLGSRFRTDGGKAANYSGPYWTLFAFSPSARAGLTVGQALQQSHLVAIDEKTGFISEVRIVQNPGKVTQQVTQTKFNNWFENSGQWYPGQIVRLENGQQVLSMTVQQGAAGAQLPLTAFQP